MDSKWSLFIDDPTAQLSTVAFKQSLLARPYRAYACGDYCSQGVALGCGWIAPSGLLTSVFIYDAMLISAPDSASIKGRAAATDTPIGYVPTPASLSLEGLNISRESLDELLSVNSADWAQEAEATAKFFEIFGDRLPQEISSQQKSLTDRLTRTTVASK